MSWFDHVPDVHLDVDCEGATHRLSWHRGHLVAHDHEDLDAERVLVALGGTAPRCLELAELWAFAIENGGFIEEWAAHLDPDTRRLWWLRTALERLRSEGVQDFLYDMARADARRMCEAVVELPHPWLDRAAGHVVAATAAHGWAGRESLARHVGHAIRLRARRAFVDAVTETAGRDETLRPVVRSAALVPFRCTVTPGPAEVDGLLAGRRSSVEIRLDPGWLADVWARGVAVVDGHLVLAVNEIDTVDADPAALAATLLAFRPDADSASAVATAAELVPGETPGRWHLAG